MDENNKESLVHSQSQMRGDESLIRVSTTPELYGYGKGSMAPALWIQITRNLFENHH